MRSPVSYTVALVGEARQRAILHVVIEQPRIHQMCVRSSSMGQGLEIINKMQAQNKPAEGRRQDGSLWDSCSLSKIAFSKPDNVVLNMGLNQ